MVYQLFAYLSCASCSDAPDSAKIGFWSKMSKTNFSVKIIHFCSVGQLYILLQKCILANLLKKQSWSKQPTLVWIETEVLRCLTFAATHFCGLFCVPRSAFFRGQSCFRQQTHVGMVSQTYCPAGNLSFIWHPDKFHKTFSNSRNIQQRHISKGVDSAL